MPKITMLEAIRAALLEEMERDPAVVTRERILESMAAHLKPPKVCWQNLALSG